MEIRRRRRERRKRNVSPEERLRRAETVRKSVAIYWAKRRAFEAEEAATAVSNGTNEDTNIDSNDITPVNDLSNISRNNKTAEKIGEMAEISADNLDCIPKESIDGKSAIAYSDIPTSNPLPGYPLSSNIDKSLNNLDSQNGLVDDNVGEGLLNRNIWLKNQNLIGKYAVGICKDILSQIRDVDWLDLKGSSAGRNAATTFQLLFSNLRLINEQSTSNTVTKCYQFFEVGKDDTGKDNAVEGEGSVGRGAEKVE